MAIYNLGRFYPIFKGTWSRTTQYVALDIVYWLGSSYVAKADNIGETPSANSPSWQIMAAAGEISGVLTPEQHESIVADLVATSGMVVDPDYVHTDRNFTEEAESAVNNIGRGVLYLWANGTKLGAFGANDNESSTIEIPIPTKIDQLQGTDEFYRTPKINFIPGNEAVIEMAEGGSVYVFDEPVNSITIESLPYESIIDGFKARDIELYFTADDGFTMACPSFVRTLGSSTVEFGQSYLATIHAGMLKIEKLGEVKN